MAKHHNYLCRLVKKSAKEDRERYIQEVCKDVEKAKEHNKTRAVYEGIRKITGKYASQVKSVKDDRRKILTYSVKVKKRWQDYFDKLYNDRNEVDEDYLETLEESSNKDEGPPIGRDEVEAAIKRLKLRKAPGVDSITAEEIVAATQGVGLSVIHRLCKRVWEEEELPTEWKRSIIVPIHKKKDKLDCSNIRNIFDRLKLSQDIHSRIQQFAAVPQ